MAGQHADTTTHGARQLAHDRRTDAAPQPRRQRLPSTLNERLENAFHIFLGNARPLIDAFQPQVVAIHARQQADFAAFGTEIDGIGKQVVDDHRQLFPIDGDTEIGRLNRQRQVSSLAVQFVATDGVGQERTNVDRTPDQAAAVESGRIQAQQSLDLALQGDHAVLEDADDLELGSPERTGNLFLEERHTFAQGGQRGLEFVRHVAQHPLTVRLQFRKSLPQPVQLPAELPEVGWPADNDRFVEALFPEPGDRQLEIAQGTDQPPADGHGDEKRPGQRQTDLSAETQPAGLQFDQQRAVPGIDPVLSRTLQQAVDFGQASHDRSQLRRRKPLIKSAAQGVGTHPPIAKQGSEGLCRKGIEAVDNRHRLSQMVVEPLTDYRVLQYLELPGAACEVDSALAQFLYPGRNLQRLLAIHPALLDKPLDHEPTAQRCASEKDDDHHEAGQHGLAE